MPLTMTAGCPAWCAGQDEIAQPDSEDEMRRHRAPGVTVDLDFTEGARLNVRAERYQLTRPHPDEESVTDVIRLEFLWPAGHRASGKCSFEIVPPGSALRWARLVRVAADELAAELRFRDVRSDEPPDWSFMLSGASRAILGHHLTVCRVPVSLGRARLTLGHEEAETGVAGLREVAEAVEHEVNGILDHAVQ